MRYDSTPGDRHRPVHDRAGRLRPDDDPRRPDRHGRDRRPNRDPSHFPAPASLDLAASRPRSRHLAFGHGPHYCLGSVLARAEARIALASLLHQLPGLHLGTTPEQLEWRPSRDDARPAHAPSPSLSFHGRVPRGGVAPHRVHTTRIRKPHRRCVSGSRGTRTHNLRIKSPKLPYRCGLLSVGLCRSVRIEPDIRAAWCRRAPIRFGTAEPTTSRHGPLAILWLARR